MAKVLVIGDVHAVPNELVDCEALLRLIVETVEANGIEHTVFLGDQHHCHNVLDSRVVDFWTNVIRYRVNTEITFLIGNHDFANPYTMMPHSMVAHKFSDNTNIIDRAQQVLGTNFCAMPYYHNPEAFVEEAVKLKEAHPECDLLFCHQTFCGADYGAGFYAKDAVEPSAVPFKVIVSGHLHKPMMVGKVWYPGAPRWKTLTDAEVETRNIWVLEEGKAPVAVPTNTHCTRIFRLEDSEDKPLSINLTQDELTRADLRIVINGTADYISKRMTELKARYNAKCQGKVTRGRLAKASESEGIENAFQRFSKAFNPPNGTDRGLLLRETYGRL